MMQKFGENKEKLTTQYLKYKKYYDQKDSAEPTSRKSFCLFFNPKLLKQSTVIASLIQKWLPLYRVQKVRTDSNFSIQKQTETTHNVSIILD